MFFCNIYTKNQRTSETGKNKMIMTDYPNVFHCRIVYCRIHLQEVPNHLVQSASFFVPQTCILSSITAKNQSHRSKVQSFTISGSPATRVPASQQWIVQWVEIFSSRCARSVNFFVIAFLFVKSLVKFFPRCARPFLFVKSFCNCFWPYKKPS